MTSLNAASELLRRSLELNLDKPVYLCGDRSLSSSDLDAAARRCALLLHKKGVQPGDRVLIVAPDCFAFPVAFLGCLLAGAVAVAVSTALREEDFAYIMKDSGARLLLKHITLQDRFTDAEQSVRTVPCGDDGPLEQPLQDNDWQSYEPSQNDFAFMLYSSGTTGVPKGIPHRHKDLLLICELAGGPILGITSQDVIFSASKFSFSYGLIASLAFPLYFGATAIIHPGLPRPVTLLEIIECCRPTMFFSVPTVYTQIILACADETLPLPMRLCFSAGEALPAAVFEEWRRLTGLELIDGIGSTEATWCFISNRPGTARPGSAGQLIPGYRARLVDGNGNDVPSGSEGNLLIAGDTIAPCYWNLPDKTAETMLPDGFIRTGDVFVERDGFYYHQGRSDDMIKSGAHWVSPVVVENVLREHPAVSDCAVAAVSAGVLLKPGAFVVLASGTERTPMLERELRGHLLTRLPDYMCPARFRFVEDLPRTSTGKVQRFRLKNLQ